MATLVMRVSNGSVYRCDECGDTFTVIGREKAVCPMCSPLVLAFIAAGTVADLIDGTKVTVDRTIIATT